MEKTVKLNKRELQNGIVVFDGKPIEVKPFLSVKEQVAIIKRYIDVLHTDKVFEDFTEDYVGAELNLIFAVIDSCTNIDTDDIDVDNFDYKLWLEIKNSIRNYEEFEKRLNLQVESERNRMNLDRSVGGLLDNFFFDLSGLLQKISDMNPQDFEKSMTMASDAIKELNQTPLSKILEENKTKKTTKRKEKIQ